VKGEQVFVVHNFYFYFYFCGQILSFFSTKRIGIFWEFFWGSVNMIISLSCWKDGKILQIFISKQLGQKKKTPPSRWRFSKPLNTYQGCFLMKYEFSKQPFDVSLITLGNIFACFFGWGGAVFASKINLASSTIHCRLFN
jgi:hypothetical protein